MMPHIPTFSGRNPDVSIYGAFHGAVRTGVRLGPDASAGVTITLLGDPANRIIRPYMTVSGTSGSVGPAPGTYDPMSPAHGLFFCVPYFVEGEFPLETRWSVLRARLRDPQASHANINYDATPNGVWTDPAVEAVSWSSWTQNYVGNASVYLDLAFDGNTSNYQTYLISNTYIA